MSKRYPKDNWIVPFNLPFVVGKETEYISQAHRAGQLAGDGMFTKKCQEWFEKNIKVKKALLVHSCTAALEMMAILAEVKPKDEVIMPSFTFVSTANAFVLRGAKPVFVDIRRDTLNIDESLIEGAITKKTKAIMLVHYAGVGCEMDKIRKIADNHNLYLFEDAAQGLLSKYKNCYLGSIGHLGAFSFHETKNIISGEGGVLLLNDSKLIERAEVIRDCGTNRNELIKGKVNKYTWIDIGSSYLTGEVTAAFLLAQLEHSRRITTRRVRFWNKYHTLLKPLEKKGYIRRPIIPKGVTHNGHIYYILTDTEKTRDGLISYLKSKKIMSVFHYVPLHSSPAGVKYSKFEGNMEVTNTISDTLLRLPLYNDIDAKKIEYVVDSIESFFLN